MERMSATTKNGVWRGGHEKEEQEAVCEEEKINTAATVDSTRGEVV